MNPTLETIFHHRSIRKYQEKEIPQDVLERVLEAGTRASNTGNMQVYSVVVTQSAEMKAKLSPLHFNQPMIKQASVVLTVAADVARFQHWCEINGAERSYDNFLWFVCGCIDSMLFAQNIAVAAEAEGLGLCFLGTTLYNPQGIVDVLGLPRLVAPVATITLGWPAEEPAQTDRLPLSAIVHDEHYHDYDAQTIDNAYSEKESLPENLAFVRENGKQTLAQVFTDVRYTRRDNEALSRGYLDMLRHQGFLRE